METALTGEGVFLLVIATAIALICGWLAWRCIESTEDDARSYAECTIQRCTEGRSALFQARIETPAYDLFSKTRESSRDCELIAAL